MTMTNESKMTRSNILKELSSIGLTYEKIGKALGVSRQRVEQLISNNYVSIFKYAPKNVDGHNIISLLLKTRGFSLKDVSEKTGISVPTMANKMYSSKTNTSNCFKYIQALAICKMFDEDIDVLFDKIDRTFRKEKLSSS